MCRARVTMWQSGVLLLARLEQRSQRRKVLLLRDELVALDKSHKMRKACVEALEQIEVFDPLLVRVVDVAVDARQPLKDRGNVLFLVLCRERRRGRGGEHRLVFDLGLDPIHEI
eukprot:Amastigsp_a339564_1667.p4 type:complete len:114 gc:universal Amastigsp_a339564_1667:694-353(-)